MTTDDDHTIHDRIGEPDASAVPPALTFVGALADLTQKQVGAGDGTTFLRVDIGG